MLTSIAAVRQALNRMTSQLTPLAGRWRLVKSR
jgi:hypothetical protein